MPKAGSAVRRFGPGWGLLLLALLAACGLPASPTPSMRALPEPTASFLPAATTSPALPGATPSPSSAPGPAVDLVVYARAGQLWASDGRSAHSLVERGPAYAPLLSPDGRRLLYRRRETPTELAADPFSLWLYDMSTGQETAVDLSVLPAYPLEFDGRTLNLPRWPATIAWMPDGQSLLFNTYVDFSAVGPGSGLRDDLWQVEAATGQVRLLSEEAQPPASFAISPDGEWLLVSRPTRIEALRPATGERRTLLEFPAVLTYSEYAWLPQPRWMPDGRTAQVAIAPPDPLTSTTFALWRLHVEPQGPAEPLGQVEGAVFAWSPDGQSWSPDGSRLVYLSGPPEARQVVVADATGARAMPVANAAPSFTLLGWSPDGGRALYTAGGALYLIEDGPQPQVRPLGEVGMVAQLAWLPDSLLVVTPEGRLLRVPLSGAGVQEVEP